jgi:putative tricarboxylic transport membrane protein
MDLLANLSLGFSTALTPAALLYCLLGVTLGTAIGVLPGIGALAAIAMLLPVTFHLPPTLALIMLAGIYYGAQYGGSTASILLNLPGTPSNAIVCLDGYPMAQQGRAGPALVMTTLASFFGGCVAVLVVALFAPVLASVALQLSAPEYFSIMVLALLAAGGLSQGAVIKGLGMVVLGLLLSTVGTDLHTGVRRLTFGLQELADGLEIIILAMALFGVAEVITNLAGRENRTQFRSGVPWRELIPSRSDLKLSFKAVLRGTGIGSVLGIFPGTGPTVSSFLAYSVEKRMAKDPSRFGKGAIEGVAAPEAANNAAAQTSFIPTLTLGIPGDVVMALMLGALMIQGIAPGPGVMTRHPELFWGLIVSFWIGNLMLLALNLPLVNLWVRLLSVPYRFLFPTVILLVSIGVYSVRNSSFDVLLTAGFGLLGFVLVKLRCGAAPLILGYVLGPLIEENLRRSLLLSRGDPMIFLTRPVSLAVLIITVVLVILITVSSYRASRTR